MLRLQALRGTYGIAAPAPICPEPGAGPAGGEDCQVLQAPSAPGQRLVTGNADAGAAPAPGGNDEIRLTYGELTALIEDAVKQLR